MLNIKKKTPFTHNIRSIVHCRNCSMKQNVDCSCFQKSDELISMVSIYTACFPLEPIKMRNFHDIFQGLSRTKVLFQDFPGPGMFKKKIQDFPGGVGTSPNSSPVSTIYHTR